jgi:hypothetical protein
MKRKILVTEQQLKYIIDFIGDNDLNEQQTIIRKKRKGDAYLDYDLNKKLGSSTISDVVTPEDINNSIEWIKNNGELYIKLRSEFEKRLPNKNLWNDWIKVTTFLTSPEYKKNIDFTNETTREKYSGIFYVVNFLKLYNDKYRDKKIKRIAIGKLGDKLLEKGSEIKPITTPINFTVKLENKLEVKPFQDNSTQPTQMIFDSLDGILNSLNIALQESINNDENLREYYEKNKDKFFWECTDLMVASSASRYANTGSASKKNFITLSKERAENGFEAIKNYIISKGINIGENVGKSPTSIQYTGDNGDGSSGPPPPKYNKIADLNLEGADKVGVEPKYVGNDESELYNTLYNQSVQMYGTPYGNKNLYDKHKFFVYSVNFKLNIKDVPMPDDLPPKKIKSYIIKFYTYNFELNLRPPVFELTLPKPPIGRPKKTKVDSCPQHGKKGWWTDLNF